MVGLGLLMIALGAWSLWLRGAGACTPARLPAHGAVDGPAGLLAMLAGWITTEVGRQPWVVYGVLRTADGASKHGAGPLALSLALFVVAYLFVFGAGIAYVLRLVRKGPQAFDTTGRRRAGRAGRRDAALAAAAVGAGRPARPRHLKTTDRENRHGHRHHRHLGHHHLLLRLHVRGAGRLRPRHRHAVSLRAGQARARHHDEHGGAGLGRQRDLAGAGRRGLLAAFPVAYSSSCRGSTCR
jgi:hypothetical protein